MCGARKRLRCCRATSPNGDAGGNGGCNTFTTLQWFMQVPGVTLAASPGRQLSGCTDTPSNKCAATCYNSLFYDPLGSNSDFMDNAVIYGITMAQGTSAVRTVGYFGSVRVSTTNGYDYTWVF